MTNPILTPVHSLDHPSANAWSRFGWVWSAIFLVALLVCSLLTLLDDAQTAVSRLVLVALAITSVGWHLLFVIWWPRRTQIPLRGTPRQAAIFLLVTVLLYLPLAWLDPIFTFGIGTIYGLVYFFLPIRWALPASLLLTLSWSLLRQTSAGSIDLLSQSLWVGLAITLISGLIALWLERIIIESATRAELIAALEQAQAELAASERRAGVLAERQRLAHELHDTLAQGFIGIIMRLETAVSHLTPGEQQAIGELEKAVSEARHNLTQVRRVVQNLRPASLEKASLPEALEATVAKWQAASGVTAKTVVTGTMQPLSNEQQHVLLRAVQEALANVRKHAQATIVQVTLSYIGDTVLLDVQDDGIGMQKRAVGPDDQWQGGYGLTAMRERVTHEGGTLEIESEPEDGVTVTVSLPLGSEQ